MVSFQNFVLISFDAQQFFFGFSFIFKASNVAASFRREKKKVFFFLMNQLVMEEK